MKITGIIAEYNPFHNGHLYHLNTARTKTDADYIIVVMSGDYTQRGLPAVMDKYLRTKMALSGGADLVLELPLPYAAGSAEYFATGAVTLLDKLGCTDALCFGSECGETTVLKQVAQILNEEPGSYKEALQSRLAEGVSYPAAQAYALNAYFQDANRFGIEANSSLDSGLDSTVSAPNNRLGIEYIKALLNRNSRITPVTIQREGAGYHDASIYESSSSENGYSSALAIRQSLFDTGDLAQLRDQVPAFTGELFDSSWQQNFPVSPNDFSLLLQYKLLTLSASSSAAISSSAASLPDVFTDFWDVSPDMADKIAKSLPKFSTFTEFCDLLKSKNLTHTRISRSLLHILLNIRNEHIQEYISHDYIPYARILGFRETTAPLLHKLKQNTSIPMLSKLADAKKLLDPWGCSMLEREITASHIYEAVISQKFKKPVQNEYTRQIMIFK